jgi:hypothetical protein
LWTLRRPWRTQWVIKWWWTSLRESPAPFGCAPGSTSTATLRDSSSFVFPFFHTFPLFFSDFPLFFPRFSIHFLVFPSVWCGRNAWPSSDRWGPLESRNS